MIEVELQPELISLQVTELERIFQLGPCSGSSTAGRGRLAADADGPRTVCDAGSVSSARGARVVYVERYCMRATTARALRAVHRLRSLPLA
jgi:ketosteroid isomerase-like protein